ncbi:Cyclin-J18-like [Nymphaea thermarum]|nr:Cyclin-J18-like [Nymphaea thermarum]
MRNFHHEASPPLSDREVHRAFVVRRSLPFLLPEMHDVSPLSVRTLKSLADVMISDQHFTARDFIEAEMVFMKVLRFEIGAANIAFFFLEELLYQFREIAKVGDSLKLSVCMDIMDLLYEDEGTSLHHYSPRSLAAAILVCCFLMICHHFLNWSLPLGCT